MDLGRPVARHHVRRPHEQDDADPGPPDAIGQVPGDARDEAAEPAQRGPAQRRAAAHR